MTLKYLYIMPALLVLSLSSSSKIVFEKTVHDFGAVDANSEVRHVFNFNNEGTGKLIIKDVKAG